METFFDPVWTDGRQVDSFHGFLGRLLEEADEWNRLPKVAMVCPKCGHEGDGREGKNLWCGHCGTQMELKAGEAVQAPMANPVEYDSWDILSTSLSHTCAVCGQQLAPQTLKRLLRGKTVVGWACLFHPLPRPPFSQSQEEPG